MDQEQKPREPSFISELVIDLRPTRKLVRSGIRTTIVVVLLATLLLLYIIGSLFGVTPWNILKVLAVTLTVGAAVPLLNWLQKKRELEIAELRAEADREGAEHRAQDEALQAYLEPFSKRLALFEEEQVSKSAGQHFGFFLLRC